MKAWVRMLASFFYVGYLPWIPGSFGSLAGLLLAWFLSDQTLWVAIALSVLGIFLCRPAQQAFQSEDPEPFVLDEVCGMMLAVAGLGRGAWVFAAAFLLFRILDTLKPWPIRLFQEMKNPAGIMLDDLAAGLIVNVIFQIISRYSAL